MTAYRCYQCHEFSIPIFYEYVCSDCRRSVTLTDVNGEDFEYITFDELAEDINEWK